MVIKGDTSKDNVLHNKKRRTLQSVGDKRIDGRQSRKRNSTFKAQVSNKKGTPAPNETATFDAEESHLKHVSMLDPTSANDCQKSILTEQDGVDDDNTKDGQVSEMTTTVSSFSKKQSTVCTMLDQLDPKVLMEWNLQKDGMKRNFQASVRDFYFANFKFHNQKICENVVCGCIANREIVKTAGMTLDEFVEVTAKSNLVRQHFNSNRHGVETKMRVTHMSECFI